MTDNGKPREVVRRRRRTRRHHRNRVVRRTLAIATLTVCVAALSTFALKIFVPSLFEASVSAPSLDSVGIDRSEALNKVLSEAQPPRPVYPYSVVPGGVEDVNELKWAAEHDPVVAAHYAGFDYDHAQVVRVTLARTAFVSYRIGNRIYWTRRRIALHKGEKLITDGKMTARTRCANQVKETPQQQAAAPVEPQAQKFDEPIRAGTGTARQDPAVAFESALMTRPAAPGLGAAQPLSLYDPFVGGGFISLAPPPLPAGLCAPTKKKSTNASADGETEAATGKKKRPGPCGGGTGSIAPVPEPGTWVFFISGLAAMFWWSRRRLARG